MLRTIRVMGSVRRVHRASRVGFTVVGALLVLFAAGCGGSKSNDSKGVTLPTGPKSTFKLSSALNNAQVVPKPKTKTKGSGKFTGTIEIVGSSGTNANGTINWRLKFTGLNGKATSAQIFFGGPRQKGLAAVDLCAPCSSGAHGVLGANGALLNALVSRPIYVSVATKRNAKGEIRGHVVVKPTGKG